MNEVKHPITHLRGIGISFAVNSVCVSFVHFSIGFCLFYDCFWSSLCTCVFTCVCNCAYGCVCPVRM